MTEACWKTIGTQGDGACPKLGELSHCRNCADYIRAGRGLLDREMPETDRKEWACLLAQPKQEVGDTIALMIFRVANEWLALPASAMEQVVDERMVHVVPGRSNRSFRGLVNIDGELLLCYSAAHLIGLEEEGTPRRMLVVGQGSERMVFSADEVAGVQRIAQDSIEEPPATVGQSPSALTKALFHLGERHIGLLDADRWLACAARSIV